WSAACPASGPVPRSRTAPARRRCARSRGARPRCGPRRPGTPTRGRCRAARSGLPPPRGPSPPGPAPPAGAAGPGARAAPPPIPPTIRSSAPPCPLLAERLEDDHRDLPGGLPFVVGEPGVGRLVRRPDLVPFGTLGHAGTELHGRGADLGFHIGMGQQVVV